MKKIVIGLGLILLGLAIGIAGPLCFFVYYLVPTIDSLPPDVGRGSSGMVIGASYGVLSVMVTLFAFAFMGALCEAGSAMIKTDRERSRHES